ncbi:MAG: RDD family protein [Flavobacteriales bacterium]|nr:RDD family protein [Bacteroidota bacterium]MCB9240024.1 RDD family protein [Flavobacteriales bacterium]
MNEILDDLDQQDEPILASPLKRLVGFMIDHILNISILMSAVMPFVFSIENEDEFPIGWFITLFLLGFSVLYGLRDSFKGVSLGKWVVGTMVRDQYDYTSIPSTGRLFIRNLLLILGWIEGVILMLDRQRRRAGDMVAKTVVLDNPIKAKLGKRILVAVVVIALLPVVILGTTFQGLSGSNAYEAAQEAIRNDGEVMELVGEIESMSKYPNSSIRTSGFHAYAEFEVGVDGSKQDVVVEIKLHRDGDSPWVVDELTHIP